MKTQTVVAPLAANGGANGILTVNSTLPFVLGATVYLAASGQVNVALVIDAILDSKTMQVRQSLDGTYPPPTGPSSALFNASAYTVASSAVLTQNVQDITSRSAFEDYLVRKIDASAGSLGQANGRKRFVQSIAFTTLSAFTTLNTSTVDSTAIPANAQWVFQPDADAQLLAGSAANAVTNTNSLWIQAGQQEWQSLLGGDVGINLKGRTVSGNLQVFVVF